ncbi:MAG TPA: ABC transporter permease [Chloroflexota bacterium]|nr:ABC transporter permease [Chloroflexota bacterium]
MSLQAAPASASPIDPITPAVGDLPETDVPLTRAARRRALARSLLRSPSAVVGGAVIVFWVFCAIFWPLIVPYSPTAPDYAHMLAKPSWQHLAGTDATGRDVFSRVLAGSREVLILAPLATAIGLVGGIIVGLVTAYYGGWLDDIVNRVLELMLAFPLIIVLLLILSLYGSSETNIVLVVGINYIPLIARVVRTAALSVRNLDYVAAARLRGARGPAIMLTEILPNSTGPIIVEGTVRVGYAIFTIASLSFLGLGGSPDSTNWGSMVSTLKDYLTFNPWLSVFPIVAIASLVVSLNLLADGIRQAVSA